RLSTQPALRPGTAGTLLLESYIRPGPDLGLSTGQVRFTVDAPFLPIYGNPALASNFGLDKFGFNTDLYPLPTNIVVSDAGHADLGWIVKQNQNISNFGSFDIEDKGDGH